MKRALIAILLLQCLAIVPILTISVGIIRNASLDILNAPTTLINGSCDDCTCALLGNSTFFSLNCFADNLTCQLHSIHNQHEPYTMTNSAHTSFYFVSLPTFVTTTSTNICHHQIPSALASRSIHGSFRLTVRVFLSGAMIVGQSLTTGEYLWPFDSTFPNSSSACNDERITDPTFSPITITGYGSSLSLNASMKQSLSIAQSAFPLFNRSWTFEAWIYLFEVASVTDYPIIGQCDLSLAIDTCLHLGVRNTKLLLGFFHDDLNGDTTVTATRWYHTAFVFDSATLNQSLYLDGVLDNT